MLRLLELVREHRRHNIEGTMPSIDLSGVPDDDRAQVLAALEIAIALSLDDQCDLIAALEASLATESAGNQG